MARDRGKEFEAKFKDDFLKTVPNSTIDRLYDPVMGYISISNIADFIGFSAPHIFYLECKSCKGASLPFSNITQYDKLIKKIGIPGVRVGIVLWLYEKDVGIIYIPISTITKMKEEGKKSFGIKHLNNIEYPSIILPSKKRKIFYDTDYSPLTQLPDGW